MAAMTVDAIVDRIRSICVGAPFAFTEAVEWDSFDQQPTQNVEAVFRVPPAHSQAVAGGFNYMEDRTDVVQIWVVRKLTQDVTTTRRTLIRDMHSLTAAIVRDAHQDSGDYSISDEGRGHTVVHQDGTEYAALRLSLPVRYEAQL